MRLHPRPGAWYTREVTRPIDDDELASEWHDLMGRYHRITCALDRSLTAEHGLTVSEFGTFQNRRCVRATAAVAFSARLIWAGPLGSKEADGGWRMADDGGGSWMPNDGGGCPGDPSSGIRHPPSAIGSKPESISGPVKKAGRGRRQVGDPAGAHFLPLQP